MTKIKIALCALTFIIFSLTSQAESSLNIDKELSFGSKVGYNLANRYLKIPQGLADDQYVTIHTNIPFVNGNGMASVNIRYWGYENNWETVVGWYVYYGIFYSPNSFASGINPPTDIKLINNNGKISIAVPIDALSVYGSISVSKEIGGVSFPANWEKGWAITGATDLPAGYNRDVKVVVSSSNGADETAGAGNNNISNTNLKLNANREHDLAGNNLSFVDGKVGVGTKNPKTNLHVNSKEQVGLIIENSEGLNKSEITSGALIQFPARKDTFTVGPYYQGPSFSERFGLSNGVSSVSIRGQKTVIGLSKINSSHGFENSSNVTISGTVQVLHKATFGSNVFFNKSLNVGDSNFKVEENGNVWATKITVEVGPFPDYVFSTDYELPSIKSVEGYIKKNGKLPKMSSADEVSEHGVDLGELSRLQQEKIEELTLYIINLNNRLNDLEMEK
ncbi:MAG: hypothetical protein ACJAZ2_002084 [Glaciecola sp.]|jgi:hypothetical protein